MKISEKILGGGIALFFLLAFFLVVSAASVISVDQGGTGAESFPQDALIVGNGENALSGSSSPMVGYVYSTSTLPSVFKGYFDVRGSGTSTFIGGIFSDALRTNLLSCDSLDTDASGAIICGTDDTGTDSADDLSDDDLDALQNVTALTEATGDILYYNSNWQALSAGTRGTILSITTDGIPGWISTSTFAHLKDDNAFTGTGSTTFAGNVDAAGDVHADDRLTTDGHVIVRGSATSSFVGGVFADAFRTNLPSCDSVDTDASGAIVCGTDDDDLSDNNLTDLSDVDTSGVSDSDILMYHGASWIPAATSTFILAGEIDTYSELDAIVSDVTLTHNGLIDSFSELDTIVSDKSLANLDDAQTFTNSGTTTLYGNAGSFQLHAFDIVRVGSTGTTTISGTGTSTFGGGIFANALRTNLPNCSGASVLETDATGAIVCGADAGAGGGISSINGLSASDQTFSNTNNDPLINLSISSVTDDHNFILTASSSPTYGYVTATSTTDTSVFKGDVLVEGDTTLGSATSTNLGVTNFNINGDAFSSFGTGLTISASALTLSFTEANLESFLSDATDVFTNNDGALADDDLTDDTLTTLSDVNTAGAADSNILMLHGGTWVDVSTSTLAEDTDLHDAVTLAGEDYLSLATQEITANAINPDNLASADFGDLTCNGTNCSLDANTVNTNELDLSIAPTWTGLHTFSGGIIPTASSTIGAELFVAEGVYASSTVQTSSHFYQWGSATSTFEGGLYADALRTNLPSCDSLDTDASGAIICGSDATGGSGTFSWDTNPWGNSTTTILGFNQGFLAHGSSTIDGVLHIENTLDVKGSGTSTLAGGLDVHDIKINLPSCSNLTTNASGSINCGVVTTNWILRGDDGNPDSQQISTEQIVDFLGGKNIDTDAEDTNNLFINLEDTIYLGGNLYATSSLNASTTIHADSDISTAGILNVTGSATSSFTGGVDADAFSFNLPSCNNLTTDASGGIVCANLDLANTVTGTLAVGNGGTGVTSLSDILGTSDQISVSGGTGTVIGGDVTLSLPTDILLTGSFNASTTVHADNGAIFGGSFEIDSSGNLASTGTGTSTFSGNLNVDTGGMASSTEFSVGSRIKFFNGMCIGQDNSTTTPNITIGDCSGVTAQ